MRRQWDRNLEWKLKVCRRIPYPKPPCRGVGRGYVKKYCTVVKLAPIRLAHNWAVRNSRYFGYYSAGADSGQQNNGKSFFVTNWNVICCHPSIVIIRRIISGYNHMSDSALLYYQYQPCTAAHSRASSNACRPKVPSKYAYKALLLSPCLVFISYLFNEMSTILAATLLATHKQK